MITIKEILFNELELEKLKNINPTQNSKFDVVNKTFKEILHVNKNCFISPEGKIYNCERDYFHSDTAYFLSLKYNYITMNTPIKNSGVSDFIHTKHNWISLHNNDIVTKHGIDSSLNPYMTKPQSELIYDYFIKENKVFQIDCDGFLYKNSDILNFFDKYNINYNSKDIEYLFPKTENKMITIKEIVKKEYLTEKYINVFNPNDKQKYVDEVWNVLQRSYAPIGGFLSASNKNELIDDSWLWKIVKKDNKIKAVSIYKDKFGRKSIASGTDGSVEGREYVKQIMRDNMKFSNTNAWAEVSGAPEYLLLKFGGKKIPNKYAAKITGKQIISLNDDGFHYTRMIAGEPHEKIIIGNVDFNKVPGLEPEDIKLYSK